MDMGDWIKKVLYAVVLLIVLAALFGPLNDALADYAANETTFGPILQTLVPLLIGVGIVIAFIAEFIPGGREKLGF